MDTTRRPLQAFEPVKAQSGQRASCAAPKPARRVDNDVTLDGELVRLVRRLRHAHIPACVGALALAVVWQGTPAAAMIRHPAGGALMRPAATGAGTVLTTPARGYVHAVLFQQSDIYVNPAHPRWVSHDEQWTDTSGTVMREVITAPGGGRTERYVRLLSTGLFYGTRTTGSGNVWMSRVIHPPKGQRESAVRQYIGFRTLAEVKAYFAALERNAVEKPHVVHVHGHAMIRYTYVLGQRRWITYLDMRTGLPLEQVGNGLLLRYHTYTLPTGQVSADFFAMPRVVVQHAKYRKRR